SVPQVHFERNLVPALPSLLVVLAVVVVELVVRWSVAGTRLRTAAVVVIVLLLCWPAVLAVRATRASLIDSRAGARAWIAEHIRPQSEIFLDAYSPWVDPAAYRVTANAPLLTPEKFRGPRPDAIVITQKGLGRILLGASKRPSAVAQFEKLQAAA